MQTTLKQQITAIQCVRRLLRENKNLLNSLIPVPDTFTEIDAPLNDAGATIASLNMRGKPRQLKSMSPDELRECFKEPGFTDNYCLLKINGFDSVYNFFTFMAQHSQPNSLQWLYDHGFDIFHIIE